MLRGGYVAVLTAALAIAVAGCQNGGAVLSGAWVCGAQAEALAGQRAAPALERRFGGIDTDPAANRHVTGIGGRLAAAMPGMPDKWQFHILASDKVNAFSLPGGLVYITRGLYDRIGGDDGLLAAAMAHEMAHVIHKDSLKPPCGSVAQSLEREKAADSRGARCLAAAGYSSCCMAELLRQTADEHPQGWAKVRIRHLTEQHETTPEAVPALVLR